MSSAGCSKAPQVLTPKSAMTSSGDWREGPSARFAVLGTLSIQGYEGQAASKL